MVQYNSNAVAGAAGSHAGTAGCDLSQSSQHQPPPLSAGSKHRSMLYKPEQCLPIRVRNFSVFKLS